MKTIFVVLSACLLLACGGSDKSSQTVNRDTLTERQHDSILAQSRIPYHNAVDRAMKTADSMSAKVQRSDSIPRDTTER